MKKEPPQAAEPERFVHRPVEQHMIVSHVQVAVVVDPVRFDPHQRGDERREEQRRRFVRAEGALLALDIQHGGLP
jgi:hypothetical protein